MNKNSVDDLIRALDAARGCGIIEGRTARVYQTAGGAWAWGEYIPADDPYIIVLPDGTAALACDGCGMGQDDLPPLEVVDDRQALGWECPVCGYTTSEATNTGYCPNCEDVLLLPRRDEPPADDPSGPDYRKDVLIT
ncbi:MAG: hypothetical protein H0U25_06235 [Thermoleophilaceae bacterium]|nr:hypothetical protein [Thermoleophilaceae bacterium]